jgi:hypothetical protein
MGEDSSEEEPDLDFCLVRALRDRNRRRLARRQLASAPTERRLSPSFLLLALRNFLLVTYICFGPPSYPPVVPPNPGTLQREAGDLQPPVQTPPNLFPGSGLWQALWDRDAALVALGQNWWTGVFQPELAASLHQHRMTPVWLLGGAGVAACHFCGAPMWAGALSLGGLLLTGRPPPDLWAAPVLPSMLGLFPYSGHPMHSAHLAPGFLGPHPPRQVPPPPPVAHISVPRSPAPRSSDDDLLSWVRGQAF